MAEPWRGVCQLRSHSEAAQTLEEGERVRLGDELHADSDRRRGAEGGDASPRSSGEETGNSFGRSGSLHGSDRHAASGVSVRSSGQFLCPEATETDVSSPGGFASSSSLPSVLLASSSESSSAVFSPRTCSPASVLLPLPQNGASVSLDKSLPYEDLAQSPPCRITVAACSSASLLKSESSFSAELPCSSHSCCDTSPPQLVASSSLASVSGVARGEGEEIGQQEAPRRLSSSDPTSSSAPTEDPPPGHQAEFAARAKTEETFASLAHVREVQTKERGDQRLPGLTGGDRDGGGTGTASDGRGADGTELRGASFLWEKSPPHARDDLQTNAFRDRQRACVATGEPGMREGEKHKTETGGLREKVTSAAPGSKETSRSGNPEDTERDSCSEQAPRESRLLTAEEKLAVLQKHVQHLLAREPGAAVRTRLASRAEALRESPLDLEKLRSLCAAGMPDLCPAMRAMYWRILLGYLSHDPSRWQEDMEKKAQKEQEETATTVSSCTLGSTAEGHQGPAVASAASGRPTGSGPHGRQLLTRPLNLESVSDHPLSQKTSSEWRSYWDDADIFDQINKDVFRTRPELAFFNYDPGLSLQHQHERLLRALQTSPGQAAPQGSPNLRSFAQGTSEEEEPIPLLVDYETLMLQKVPSQDLSRISDSSVSSGASAASHASKPGRFSLRRAFLSRKTNASSESSRSSPSVAAVRASLLPSDKGTFCSEAANGVTADGSGAALHPRLDATAEPSGSEVTRPLGSTKPPLSLSPCRGCPPNLEGGGSALVCRFSSDIGRQGSSPSPTSLSTKTGHSPSSLVRFFASGLVSPRRSQRPKPGVSPGQGHAGAAEDAPLREGLVFEPNGRGSEKTGEETQASLTLSEKKEGRAKVEEHDTHQEYFVTAKELGAHRGDGETAVGAQTQGNWPLEGTSLGSSRKLGTEVTKTTRGAANLGAAFADLNANGAVKEDRKALDFLESDGGPHGEVREIYQGNPQLDEIPVNFSVENSISVEAASADRLPPGTRMPAFTRASPSFSPLAAQETQALGRPAPVEAPVASQTPKEAKETVSPLSLVGSTSRLHSSRDPLESPEGYSPFAETPERLGEDLAKTTGEHSEERLSERDLPWAGERRLDTAGDSPQTLALGTFKQTTGQAKPPQVEEAQRPRVIVGWDEQDGQEPQNTVQKKDVPFGSTEICQLSGIPPEAPGDRGEAAAKREHRSGNQLGFSHRDNVAEATESGEETPGAPGNAAFSAFSGADLHALASDEASNSSEETVPLLQPCRAPAGMQDTCDLLEPRRHYDVLGRILFVYAKVNPGIRYVQGMNELLAPIYYVIMSDPLCTDPLQAEAEIFFCFTELMQEQRDAFCKALDPTDHGVSGRIARLSALLKKKDIVVWTHLETIGVDPQFYALRWLLLLLTQEFQLPDVLVLWDAFIADDGWPLPLLYYVCVSMILWLRPALLAGDFTACMKLLQHLPAFDPQVLLRTAVRMREEDIAEGPAAVSDVSSPSASLSARANDLERLDPLRTRTQLQSLPTSSLQVSPLFGRIRNAGNALSSFASSALATSPSSSLLPRFASGFGARDGGSVGSVEPNDRGRSGGLSEAKEGDTCGLEREGERADGVSRQVSPSFGEPVRNVETDGRVVDAGRGSVLLPSYVSVGSGNAKTLSPLEEARHDRQLVPPARRSGAPLWGGEPARRGPQERGGDAGVGREARSLSEVQAGFEGQQEERDSAKEKQKEKDRKKEREEERRRKEEERRRQVISSLPAAFLTGTTDREEKRSGVASSRQREEQRHEEGMEPRREREDRFNSRSLLPWRRGEEASERDRDFDSTLSSLGEKLGELRSFAVTSFVADTARALWAAGTGSGESFIQGEREKWTEGERE